jgi:hypothetical protein
MLKATNVPTDKTLAATGGSALGSALAIIIVYVIEQHSGKLPMAVASAVTTVISATVAFIAGCATPQGANEVIMQRANGNLVSGH